MTVQSTSLVRVFVTMAHEMARKLLPLIAACLLGGAAVGSVSAWEEEAFFEKPAVTYTVSKGESVLGELRPHRVKKGDTLFDIARQYGLGYNEIVESNPGLDVWLPPPGAIVLLPMSWVLPCCERRGLVINIPEMRLYHFVSSGGIPGVTYVTTYPVGLGRDEWRTPLGKFKIWSKTEKPTWVIPESIRNERIAEDGDARTSIPGGAPDNPLGDHRLALTMPGYAIHGTNIPWGVGMQVSHGCIRLYPEDVARLFPRVPVGTSGEFVYQPVKVGTRGGEVYVEVTNDIYGLTPALWREASDMIERLGVADRVGQDRLMEALRYPAGIPVKVSGEPDARKVAVVARPEEVRGNARIPDTDNLETGND